MWCEIQTEYEKSSGSCEHQNQEMPNLLRYCSVFYLDDLNFISR